jgi:hypothetical protein
MKATQHRIVGAILPGTNEAYTMKFSAKLHETGNTKQRARTTRPHTTIETPSDITFMDRTETSLRADIQPPWADLPLSALGSAKSQHPPKCGTQ